MENMIQETDRLSQLPIDIIHHILYFLPAKDKVCTKFLSKTWLSIWYALPIFSFSSNALSRKVNLLKQDGSWDDEADKYLDLIDLSLEKLRHCIVRTQRFELELFESHERHTSRLNQFLERANKNYVSELVIHGLILDPSCKKPSLPLASFAYTNLFQVLDLKGCVLSPEILKVETRFPRLKVLSLLQVKLLTENMVENLLDKSPLLEEFCLQRCGIEHVNVCDRPTLDKLTIEAVGMIRVEAKNIEIFDCRYSGVKPLELHFDSCDNLKELYLQSNLTAEYIQELVTRAPVLEKLLLTPRIPLERLKIYSPTLESVTLFSLYGIDAKVVEIDAPKLKFYNRGVVTGAAATPPIFMNNVARCKEVKLIVEMGTHNLPTYEWFIHSKKCLESFKYTALVINMCSDMDLVLEKLREAFAVPPVRIGSPVYLELLAVECDWSSFDFSALFNCCFWICRPKMISIFSSGCSFNFDFVEVLRNKLIPWDNNPVCCRNSDRECWRHYLEDVRIENPQCCRNSKRKCRLHLHYLMDYLEIVPTEVEKRRQINLHLKWKTTLGRKRRTNELLVRASKVARFFFQI